MGAKPRPVFGGLGLGLGWRGLGETSPAGAQWVVREHNVSFVITPRATGRFHSFHLNQRFLFKYVPPTKYYFS